MDGGAGRGRAETRGGRVRADRSAPPKTPDGRYIVVRGRLWRTSNPHLTDADRNRLVESLMDARRAVAAARRSGDPTAESHAHEAVDAVKIELGERGPVWWDDGSPTSIAV